MDHQVASPFCCCTSTASFLVRPHCANVVPDETDAEKILTAFPSGELEKTTVTPLYYVDEDYPEQDLKSNNLSLNDATDVAQNGQLWKLMSTFGSMHC